MISLSDEDSNYELDDIIEDNAIHISDTVEEGTEDEDGIGLSDLESNSHESQDGSDDRSDLRDFIDDKDAPSNDTDDENDDNDLWYS